jgi:hypothetical protein
MNNRRGQLFQLGTLPVVHLSINIDVVDCSHCALAVRTFFSRMESSQMEDILKMTEELLKKISTSSAGLVVSIFWKYLYRYGHKVHLLT